MTRWILLLLAVTVFAGDEASKPDYMKRKPAAKEEKKVPPPPKDDKADAKAESSLPVVTEMKVERANSGNAVSAGKPVTKKESPVHGEVRGMGTQYGKQGSGTAVVQDKKNGKWAVTASGEKSKVQ